MDSGDLAVNYTAAFMEKHPKYLHAFAGRSRQFLAVSLMGRISLVCKFYCKEQYPALFELQGSELQLSLP